MFYIFFDCDGVINSENSWFKPFYIDKEKVKLVSVLAKYFKAKIVLTSTWKKGFDIKDKKCSPQILTLKEYFREYGIELIYSTPNLINRTRDVEIERFLYYHPTDNYIILDDDESLFVNKTNLYLINSKFGITEKDIKKIIKTFK